MTHTRFPQTPADIAARDATYRRMAAGHAFAPFGASCGRCGGARKHHAETTEV